MMKKYDFDEIIDRKNTYSLNVDGYKGYIFSDDSIELSCKDEDLIRMWVADMEFATPDFVLDAVKERLDRRILGYTIDSTDDYYNIFSAWCKKMYDWSFPKKQLKYSTGVIPALIDLIAYLTKPDEKVLILTPSYGFFKNATEYNKRELVCSDLINRDGDFSIDFEDFEKKAADEKTTLFIFCNPHNPTGRIWRKEELEKVAEICKENNLWVISDEIHCDILRTGRTHIPLAKIAPDYEKIITCMSTSKTFNIAGLMISNVIIPNEWLNKYWDEIHGCLNPLSFVAAKAAYEKGYDWLMQLREYLDKNFEFVESYLKEYLPNAKFKISESTYLAWVDVRDYVKKGEFLPLFFAKNAGVLLEGGKMFVDNAQGFIRLNLAMPRSIVEEGLKRICRALS